MNFMLKTCPYPIFHQSPYIYYSVLRKSFFFFGKSAFNTPTCWLNQLIYLESVVVVGGDVPCHCCLLRQSARARPGRLGSALGHEVRRHAACVSAGARYAVRQHRRRVLGLADLTQAAVWHASDSVPTAVQTRKHPRWVCPLIQGRRGMLAVWLSGWDVGVRRLPLFLEFL